MQFINIAIMDIRSYHVLVQKESIRLQLGGERERGERVKENNLSIQNASNIFMFNYDRDRQSIVCNDSYVYPNDLASLLMSLII